MAVTVDFSAAAESRALLRWRARHRMTTALSSFQLQQLGREVHLRSIVTARGTNAEFVGEIANVIDDMLAGKLNQAQARLRLFFKLKELGYDPETGFPEDMGEIPPAMRGSLRDLSSERRLNLIVNTNYYVARNHARAIAGNTPEARAQFPAWELVRYEWRRVPRGTPGSHTDAWQRRWFYAGESVAWQGAARAGADQPRMVALKESPIWDALARGEGGYTDTLDNGFPPFAFNSGLGWRAVPESEARAMGLDGETAPRPVPSLVPGRRTMRDRYLALPPDIRAALDAELEALPIP